MQLAQIYGDEALLTSHIIVIRLLALETGQTLLNETVFL